MGKDKPSARELYKLKENYRKADPDNDAEQRRTWKAYKDAEGKASFAKGLAVYLTD